MALFASAVTAGLALWVHYVNGEMPAVIDELVFIWQAELISQGRLTDSVPAHPEFVNIHFIPVVGDRRFGQYPVGFPLALSPWVWAGIPWGLNVSLAGASLVLAYRLARSFGGRLEAWITILLLASSPFFVAQSTIGMSHPSILFVTLLLMVALVKRDASPPRERWTALGGACVAYALNVSPFAAVPIGVVACDRWLALRRSAPWTTRETAMFLAAAGAGVVAFCAVNMATTGSPWTPAYYASGSHVRPGFGRSIGMLGHTPGKAFLNARAQLRELNEFLHGWPFSSFLLAVPYMLLTTARGLLRVARRAGPAATIGEGSPAGWDRTLVLLFVSTLAVYGFWYFPGTGNTLGPRYLYPTLFVLCVFSARGLILLRSLAGPLARVWPPAVRIAAAIPLVLLAMLAAAGTAPYLADLSGRETNRWRRATRELLRDLDRRGFDSGTVFVESTEANQRYMSLLLQSRFDDRGRRVFARSLGEEANAQFLSDRGGGPVAYVRPNFVEVRWSVVDTPAWEPGPRPCRGGGPRIQPEARRTHALTGARRGPPGCSPRPKRRVAVRVAGRGNGLRASCGAWEYRARTERRAVGRIPQSCLRGRKAGFRPSPLCS